MPLSNETIGNIGDVVLISPVYGWGWSEYISKKEVVKADVPAAFRLKLEGLMSMDSQIHSIWGRIDDSSSPYHNLYVTLMPKSGDIVELYDEHSFGVLMSADLPHLYYYHLSTKDGVTPILLESDHPRFRGFADSIRPC